MCSMSRPDRTLRSGRLSGRLLLFVFEVFVFDLDEFALFLHLLDYLTELNGSWAMMVFDVCRAHQVFLEFFIVIKVDEIEQLVETVSPTLGLPPTLLSTYNNTCLNLSRFF